MLSSVLNSEKVIEVNIAIMRAFVQMRKLFETNKELAEMIRVLPDYQFSPCDDLL